MPQGERDPVDTFSAGQIGWIDFETRSDVDIKAGTYQYAGGADAILLAFAIGDERFQVADASDYQQPIHWDDLPRYFHDHHERVLRGEAVWAAWNASFDKAIWNYSTIGFPLLEPQHIIDVMVQASAAGLPPDLLQAARLSGASRKDEAGKELIKLFCNPGATATRKTHPERWREFTEYAAADGEAMRSVFKLTKQLAMAEWGEYWCMERINERGICIDLPFVESAAELAAVDKIRSSDELMQLSNGAIRSVDQVRAITNWLLERLPGPGRDILTKTREETDDDGNITRAEKFSLTRRRVEHLIVMCQAMLGKAEFLNLDIEKMLRVLQIRLYGGSKTPAKFTRMEQQNVDGVLLGQYVFSGAGQTGRASSRGVQIHNLARDAMPNERQLIDAIVDGCGYDELATLGTDDPVSRKLSLLIRPAFIPSGDNVFVWSDWSQIEARVLPWLAGPSKGALARLQIFRDVDEDPTLPDLYTRTAADISHIDIPQVTKPIRQRGKVAELALGFGGGVGALQAMGVGYGIYVEDAEARVIVDRWRKANKWCVNFWGYYESPHDYGGLWGAVNMALLNPGTIHQAGRINYVFDPNYLGGSLICVLPSLRRLTYRGIKYETIDDLDDDGKVIGKSTHLRFARGYGRVKLWQGIFCENVVQAVAADFLRGTLARLEHMNVRAHTHDEILVECAQRDAAQTSEYLRAIMQQGFDWSEGLPLMSEETQAYYYTKSEKDHGL